ncbi:MAG: 2-dehydro-3-deoxy-6-phosphogalactonate aldolase [Burkholderiaceae bacterium]|nr:2-dehydro-3-deoxy-6-phosphogalactonate aldolase [Burkholderiaceae bacterium]
MTTATPVPVNTYSPAATALRQHLAECKLVAILRGLTPVEAQPVGDVLWQAGFRIIEVPLNSPSPLESIQILRKSLPQALVGAGTVMSVADVHAVHSAGGQLIVSPNCNVEVIRAAVGLGMVCLPGVITPTEAFAALDAGAQGLKLFPAEMVPPAAVKAMRAVLPADCLLIPVGGIGVHNMAAYLQAGASGFGMGSGLYTAGKTLEAIRQSAIELIAV